LTFTVRFTRQADTDWNYSQNENAHDPVERFSHTSEIRIANDEAS